MRRFVTDIRPPGSDGTGVRRPDDSQVAPAVAVPSRPATIYVAPDSLNAWLSARHDSSASRFVFYEDSTFTLEFSSAEFGLGGYAGRYTRTNSEFTLLFNDNAGRRQATGTLDGDALSVHYNHDMMMSDFEDGVYVLSK